MPWTSGDCGTATCLTFLISRNNVSLWEWAGGFYSRFYSVAYAGTGDVLRKSGLAIYNIAFSCPPLFSIIYKSNNQFAIQIARFCSLGNNLLEMRTTS